ncbi:MAG: sodium-dependent transporter [Methylobacter sp.]|nr:sodium-dependent transporter [Methylobacter sp.]MDP2428176.1 sodium-dependent transporter [Methylobacter sp.]MDP3053145.1 sodium-dependent transporter [Methylobacter sp.]MDP3363937.1 sodium-dependent transporter [Methylobacter sp.]MDZ4218147.1 sodium-dependent transporter [Methylobacter sp.]
MTDIKKSIHGEWSSRLAFILAATGSAVGLGNIWKFPYIAGENGGGAFVLVYLLCILLIGIPIMMAETMLGRRSRQNPIDTMMTLADEAGADKNWHYLGWMGVIAGFLILSYYSVIAGWASAYTVKAFVGSFSGADATEIKSLFDGFVGSPLQLMFWHSAFMLVTMLIVARGVNSGLEKAVRFLMPALFVLLILLVAYAMTTGHYYDQGIQFLFTPDFSKLTGDSVLTAMGHAFFTLSLGMGAIMIYGSYLPKDVSIAKTVYLIAGTDTVVALLAGIAIFPIVFASGLEPAVGPGLIFQTLPIAFGNMTGGWFFGVLFFVMLTFAALSSSISLIEPAVAWLVENKGMDRKQACIWSGAVTWLLGLCTVFSFNAWSNVKVFDRSLFELLDYLTANLMLPIGGFCIAVFAGWVMTQQHTEHELDMPDPLSYKVWRLLIRYVSPAAVFLVFLNVIGVL